MPPEHRLAGLAQDYAKMLPMFPVPPPAFEQVLKQLSEAEQFINTLQ